MRLFIVNVKGYILDIFSICVCGGGRGASVSFDRELGLGGR